MAAEDRIDLRSHVMPPTRRRAAKRKGKQELAAAKRAPRQRWLLLIHQLPPEPAYLRVKVRRRLEKLGAVALKNSVYVLPETESHVEDLQWLANEIVGDGGEATICRAVFLTGTTDERLSERLRAGSSHPGTDLSSAPFARPRGAVWVTRRNVFVDRMASAWLIRRFIDTRARFRFVTQHGYRARNGELRFDMFGGEFTHVGDRCTFETLLHRFDLADDAALRAIGEVVHDLDLKDDRFARPETAGVRAILEGIAASTPRDADRLTRSASLFDGLYGRFGGP